MLNWPEGFQRTPPGKRESTPKFSKSFSGTKTELDAEMERLGVDGWALDDVSGSSGDPGVVVRWRKDGTDYAVACDFYTSKTDNLRATYLWLNETRMRNQRPVETGQDQLAAAQLPSKDADVAADPEPHVVLGVEPDADEDDVMDAFREKVKEVHPDYGGSQAAFSRVKRARDKLL